MLEKIDACFKRLQTLDITPTLKNMETLLQTLYDLREIYNEIKNGVETDGRATNHVE